MYLCKTYHYFEIKSIPSTSDSGGVKSLPRLLSLCWYINIISVPYVFTTEWKLQYIYLCLQVTKAVCQSKNEVL